RRAGATLAAGAAATLLLAPVFDLDGLALTLAWCAHAVVLALAAAATALPVLAAAAGLAAALTSGHLALRPDLHYPRADALPILNRLLVAYGLPAAAFGALAWLRRPEPAQPPRRLPRLLAAVALLLIALLLALEIWHLAHPSGLRAAARLPEIAGIVAAWLALAVLLVEGERRWPGWPFGSAADALAAITVLVAGIGLGIAVNPAINDGVLALPGARRLLLAYGAPAALLALWASRRGRAADRGAGVLAAAAGIAALGLAFLLVNLEVRHLFHPQRLLLGTGTTGTLEHYAYSAAWLLFGAVLMTAGIWRRRRILRFSALAVLALAVLKVFLYDTATLSDPFRVLSFLGLGICLLALAGLYQRLEAKAPPS
ncbi:MAG TPA: DUF2339 domain-containing protein, partial [Thermoanaerobaculia bacterium]|nr:DUF2339 domain-containing protein [Thermoanaerobaculia bacterium]